MVAATNPQPDKLLRGDDASRLVARHFTRRSAAMTTRWRATFDLDLLQLLIVQVALSANLSHDRTGRIDLFAADGDRRPVSVMAVAQSMGLPHETVRRQALGLAERGVLIRGRGGMIVAASLFAGESGQGQVALAASDVRALAAELASMGFAAAVALDPARLAKEPDALLARYLNDLIVLGLEPLVTTFGGLLSAALFIQITASNVEHISTDPRRSAQYAQRDALPPDSERRPISVRALARELELPYATVHRRVATLIEGGMVENRDDGVIVPAEALRCDAVLRNNRKLINHVEAMFADLARL